MDSRAGLAEFAQELAGAARAETSARWRETSAVENKALGVFDPVTKRVEKVCGMPAVMQQSGSPDWLQARFQVCANLAICIQETSGDIITFTAGQFVCTLQV